jgi:hypothetical protein
VSTGVRDLAQRPKAGRSLETFAYHGLESASIDLDGGYARPARRYTDVSLDRQEVCSGRRGERLGRASLVEAVVAFQRVDASIGPHANVDRPVGRIECRGRGQCACSTVVADRGGRGRGPRRKPDCQGSQHDEQGAKRGRHRHAVWIGRAKRGKRREREGVGPLESKGLARPSRCGSSGGQRTATELLGTLRGGMMCIIRHSLPKVD